MRAWDFAARSDSSVGARISIRDVCRGKEKMGVPVAGSMKLLIGGVCDDAKKSGDTAEGWCM